MLVARYVTHHDVASVRIDASATAFPSVYPYTVIAAVGGIYLIGHKLVTAYYDRWVCLPHEEAVVSINCMRHMLLHGKIERQAALCIVR